MIGRNRSHGHDAARPPKMDLLAGLFCSAYLFLENPDGQYCSVFQSTNKKRPPRPRENLRPGGRHLCSQAYAIHGDSTREIVSAGRIFSLWHNCPTGNIKWRPRGFSRPQAASGPRPRAESAMIPSFAASFFRISEKTMHMDRRSVPKSGSTRHNRQSDFGKIRLRKDRCYRHSRRSSRCRARDPRHYGDSRHPHSPEIRRILHRLPRRPLHLGNLSRQRRLASHG